MAPDPQLWNAFDDKQKTALDAYFQPAFSVAGYGARGDGTTDDTPRIQAAINAAASAGGGRVVSNKGSVHALKQAGTKTVTNAGGSTGSQGYCLSLPSNVTLDLNGATLKKGDSTDSALWINATPDTSMTDHDFGVINGTLDGNNIQLTATALVLLTGAVRPRLVNLQIKNAMRYGILSYNNDDGYYDQISADSCAANPINFGQPFAGKEERGATFGSIRATNITADAVNPTNSPGNSFYGVLVNSTVNSIYGKTCAGGTKFQGYSGFFADTAVGICSNINGTAANCGTKMQSFAAGYTLGTVVSIGNQAEGLFHESNCFDNAVGVYRGSGNGTSGSNSDIWIDGSRLQIGLCRSVKAGSSGVQVRSTAADCRIDVCQIVNTGQVTGNASSSSAAITNAGGTCHINDLTVIDDQGTQTTNRVLSLNSASDNMRIMNFKFSSVAGTPFPWTGYTSPLVVIYNPQISTDVLHGEVSPAGAATTTAVTNNNINVGVALVQPVIEIVYLNAAAQTLGTPRVTFTANTLTFRHAAAAGTEKYGYRIVGYRKSTTQAA